MRQPRDLFLHVLADLLSAEKAIEKMLPILSREATAGSLARGLETHLEETRRHVENLEEVFVALGEEPRAVRCEGMEGLKAEHDAFVSQAHASPEILDLFLASAAVRTEHYEIAVYSGLEMMAVAMGELEVARLLGENLKDDKAMLRRAEVISKELAMTNGDMSSA